MAKPRALGKTGRINIIAPTDRQRKVAERLAEVGGAFAPAIRAAGYSDMVVKSPAKVIESRGFKQLCEDIGLTDDFLLKALTEDIARKPQRRKAELELGFKIKGHLTERQNDASQSIFNIVNFNTTIQTESQEVVPLGTPSDATDTLKV